MCKNKKILIVCGEASGDMHAANLIKEMKNIDSSLEFYGIGGEKSKAAGMNLLYDINKLSFVGLIEVIRNLHFIAKVKRNLVKYVKEHYIRDVILIDYPGFNLRLAKELKKLGVKIFYYISPQLWAWGERRVEIIKRNVDLMLCILPFEKEFYKKHGVKIYYVGHPLLDNIKQYSFSDKEKFYNEHNLDPNKDILLILPGSRSHEINFLFKETLKAAEKIKAKKNIQIIVSLSNAIEKSELKKYLTSDSVKIIKDKTYDLMKFAKVGIIKSGTSTLEAVLLGLPFIVVYKTNPITYFIGKKLVKVKYLSLANLLAGEKIVEEFLQNDCVANKIAEGCEKLFEEQYRVVLINKFEQIRKLLGEAGASKKAAEKIYESLN